MARTKSTNSNQKTLMNCIPGSFKCEWRDLRHFVAHYNSVNGTSYERHSCLDVEIRNCAQPEVLCRHESNEIVLERKTITWPEDYIEQHTKMHDLVDTLLERLPDFVGPNPTTLRIPHVNEPNASSRRAQAEALISEITSRRDELRTKGITSGTYPFPWSLCFDGECDRDDHEPASGLRIETGDLFLTDQIDPNSPPARLDALIRRNLESAKKKFSGYCDAKRILVLQLIPSSLTHLLDREWWEDYFRAHPTPPEIDEVWAATSYGGENWHFEKVRLPGSPLAQVAPANHNN